MKALVLLKKTPDTETKIVISSDGKALDQKDTKFIINPYDEFAIEEALKFKEKSNCEVVVLSFGSADCKELIVKALAMGADRGLLLSNEGLENCDSLTISKVLAAAVKAEGAEVVFCGKQAIDDDNMHVPAMVAELLSWPHINVVNKLEIDGSSIKAEREIEGGQIEVYEGVLPMVFGTNKGINTPRYASLPGIMKAKKKPFDVKTPADLGLTLNAQSSKSNVTSYKYPPQKPAGKIFKGESVKVMVEKVADLLRQEAKVL